MSIYELSFNIIKKLRMGVEVQIEQEGTGPKATNGKTVQMHYEGRLTNGTVFDSSYQRGEPLEFVLGAGQVIRGWDEGILKLNKGAKATFTISPDYAYGAQGYPGIIPPNSTLIFKVELVNFS